MFMFTLFGCLGIYVYICVNQITRNYVSDLFKWKLY